MVDEEQEGQVGESKDGTGPGGDHNADYQFGNPRARLTWHDQCQLTIMRGSVMDTRAGEHGGPADGDMPVWVTTESGLVVLAHPEQVTTGATTSGAKTPEQ